MFEDLVLLGERIAEHAAHLDAATHRLLSDLRQFDQAGGWHKQGARSCAAWLSWRVGWDLGTAREHVRVANRIADLPRVDRALQSGSLSYSKVRAITRVATGENEEMLVEMARLTTAQQLETICRKYATVRRHDADATPKDDAERRHVRRRDTADGMVRIEAVLHPEEAAIVWAALDHAAKQMCRQSHHVSAESPPGAVQDRSRVEGPTTAIAPARQSPFDRASALVTIAQEYARGNKPERSPIEVIVTVEAATLSATNRVNSATDHASMAADHVTDPSAVACFQDGTCVSAETARRLCCDAGVVTLMHDERGRPLSVGRKTRTLPGALKRALLKRDQTCRFPGCTNRLFLEGHHIKHWSDGGETSLENTISVCTHHHRYVHEYGYTIDVDADGPHFRDRRGCPVLNVPPTPHPPNLGWEAILACNEPLQITTHTNEPEWDGSRFFYADVIDQLVRADNLV